MTAIVGILNKQAVALAADSAVTITGSNGRKIFNKANKVFALSKHHPVGVMIYNSASFMDTPWETIIKIYRKQLGEKCFPLLKDYEKDFIAFLRSKNFYTTPEFQLLYLENFTKEIIETIFKNVVAQISESVDLTSNEGKYKLTEFLEKEVDQFKHSWANNSNYCNDFENYDFKMFNEYSSQIFEKNFLQLFTRYDVLILDALKWKFKELIFEVLKSKQELSNFTGLVFTGFGDDEIYPQLLPINISLVFNDRLRYFLDESKGASISNFNSSAAVCPFAQTDVINTILQGVDPSLNNVYLSNFGLIFKRYNEEISKLVSNSDPKLAEVMRNLDLNTIIHDFNNENNKIKLQNYISPLLNAVSNLSKEDLAEMAESLIYLTYLKRRITFAEESVGGPVDVAIISKGDGFVWIKRKHYFSPELNQHFSANYFKNT